jgi:hypothetical protein
MKVRIYIKSILLCALIALALGGFLLHNRIHKVWAADWWNIPALIHQIRVAETAEYHNLVPAIAAVLSIIVVPLLFLFRKSTPYAYVINSFTVIVGTITMSHYSIAHWPANTAVTISTILTGTMLMDIFILWGKFFVGKAIFELEIFGYSSEMERKGNPFRYPNLGWWLVHMVAVSVVYSLGHILWS